MAHYGTKVQNHSKSWSIFRIFLFFASEECREMMFVPIKDSKNVEIKCYFVYQCLHYGSLNKPKLVVEQAEIGR